MVYIKYGFAAFIFGMAVYYAGIGIRLLPSEFDGAKEVEKLEAALVRAEENNKLVLIDFWASWCKNCSSMKRNVLQDRKVKDILAEYYEFIEFQAEKFDDENIKEVLGYFDIKGLPAFVILRKSEE
jgi:thiol:disulfide interchange protein